MNNDFVTRLTKDRLLCFCDECVNMANQDDSYDVTNTLNQMVSLVEMLKNITAIKNKQNEDKIVKVICGLCSTQSSSLSKECVGLIGNKNDHYSLKNGSSEMSFIKNESRNKVLLSALMSFCNLKPCNLETVPDRKIKGLCIAYESILNCRNVKVITLPALGKNLRILKLTHNKSLVNSIAYPSGGKYMTIQGLANVKLPELQPPSQDFISTDDNMQVG